jgi:PAS domain S-box-containing protein
METPTALRILHVEDRTSDADQVARILKKAGLNVTIKIVSTKDTFRAALTEFAPDLIISDHNLPAFNSMEALDILQKSLCTIPFILVTGTVSEEFAVQAMREGADDYILKDRMQRLPVAVESVLEKYRLECAKQKTENMLRNIDANSLDIICTISDEGQFLHVSAASELILGYAPSEMMGKNILDFVFTEDHEAIRKANTQGAKLHNFENRYVRKNGTLVTLSWSARWDETEHIRYCVAKDITKRKKEELEKLALILNTCKQRIKTCNNFHTSYRITYDRPFQKYWVSSAFTVLIQAKISSSLKK